MCQDDDETMGHGLLPKWWQWKFGCLNGSWTVMVMLTQSKKLWALAIITPQWWSMLFNFTQNENQDHEHNKKIGNGLSLVGSYQTWNGL